ncbi:hypothetical protein COB57_03580 [Candidatus Peregrinibacteria bacterium]|nr:MAG: hypothetical protein COB57_03580 [Candidatus Peregrinibacteria bacterium]
MKNTINLGRDFLQFCEKFNKSDIADLLEVTRIIIQYKEGEISMRQAGALIGFEGYEESQAFFLRIGISVHDDLVDETRDISTESRKKLLTELEQKKEQGDEPLESLANEVIKKYESDERFSFTDVAQALNFPSTAQAMEWLNSKGVCTMREDPEDIKKSRAKNRKKAAAILGL